MTDKLMQRADESRSSVVPSACVVQQVPVASTRNGGVKLTAKNLLILGAWLLPLVFAAGGFVWAMNAQAQTQEELEQRMKVAQSEMHAHTATEQVGQAQVEKRIMLLEKQAEQQAVVNEKMMTTLERLDERLRLQAENIVALCMKNDVRCNR